MKLLKLKLMNSNKLNKIDDIRWLHWSIWELCCKLNLNLFIIMVLV